MPKHKNLVEHSKDGMLDNLDLADVSAIIGVICIALALLIKFA